MAEQDKLSPAPPPEPSMPAPPDPIPSTSKLSNLTRIQRNVAEKQRRDKLNGYISELANIVPMVSMSSKRLDKTSILRLSAAHLRLSKSPLSGSKKLKKTLKWCPSFLSEDQVREILESVDGFLIVTSSSGKILFTSNSVERYLGHQNIDMIGHSIFIFIHPEDMDSVKVEMERLLTASLKSGGNGPAPRCSFRCRMKEKGQPRSEVITYKTVHIAGDMTISEDDDGPSNHTKSTAIVTHIFKAFVRVVDVNPYNELSLEEATADEYVTRHGLDGTIIFADHRLSTITGHLPQEVIGLSAYEYILPEDTSVALFAHHLMFSSEKGTGMIVYRLRTRDDKYVYLKSAGCLQFDRVTSQVDHFVCVNQHITDAEGEVQLKYFVDRFIPHIKDNTTMSLFESVKALQVLGLKSPNSLSALNGGNTFNRLSTLEHGEVNNTNAIVNKKVQNGREIKPLLLMGANILSQPANHAKGIGRSDLESGIFQASNLKEMSVDKNIGTDSDYLLDQRKGKDSPHSEMVCMEKKGKTCSVPVKTVPSNVIDSSGINTHSTSQSDRTMVLTQTNVVQNNSMISLNMLANELCSSLMSQNIGIKKETLNTIHIVENNKNYIKNEKKECEYIGDDSFVEYPEVSEICNSQFVNNLNYTQIQVPEVPAATDVKDSSFQVLLQTDNITNVLDHIPLNKAYDVKVGIDSVMPNTANIYSTSPMCENFSNIKTNILLSTRSVFYNSDLHVVIPKLEDGKESVNVSNNTFPIDKLTLSDSNQLPIKMSTGSTEFAICSHESNSESSASNAVSDETLTTSMECCDDVQNMYFIPGCEVKDGLVMPDDISSVLDNTLPFHDSSLPSVDGWSEFFRHEDILNAPNAEIFSHIDGEDPLVNLRGEKAFDLW